MSRIQIAVINEGEQEGVVVLDDSFCGGNDGMEIYEADWHRDHAKKRNT